MKTLQLKVTELEKGMSIQLDSGIFKTISNVTNGFYRGSRIVEYLDGDWSCVTITTLVTIKSVEDETV